MLAAGLQAAAFEGEGVASFVGGSEIFRVQVGPRMLLAEGLGDPPIASWEAKVEDSRVRASVFWVET